MVALKQASKTKARSKQMGRARKQPNEEKYSGRVAVRLRELMERKSWDVDDLQLRLKQDGNDIPTSTLYSYLNGSRSVPLDLAPHLAAVFGIATRTFFPEE